MRSDLRQWYLHKHGPYSDREYIAFLENHVTALEAEVKNLTASNNARSEIAAICIELDCCMYEKFTKEMYVELRRRLRQLSSVA